MLSARNQFSLAAGLMLALVSGCSHSESTVAAGVVPATGTLTYHGDPVAEAQLTFWMDDVPEPGFALTDLEGKFKCMTNDSADGIEPGDYLVTVTSSKGGIPPRYADVKSSPLHVTIEDGAANDFVLQLED